jgi:hypothetical protein
VLFIIITAGRAALAHYQNNSLAAKILLSTALPIYDDWHTCEFADGTVSEKKEYMVAERHI